MPSKFALFSALHVPGDPVILYNIWDTGSARAREFVMTGRLYDAATLEHWNVVNRVLPDSEIAAKGMAFARDLEEMGYGALCDRLLVEREQTERSLAVADQHDAAALVLVLQVVVPGVDDVLVAGVGPRGVGGETAGQRSCASVARRTTSSSRDSTSGSLQSVQRHGLPLTHLYRGEGCTRFLGLYCSSACWPWGAWLRAVTTSPFRRSPPR